MSFRNQVGKAVDLTIVAGYSAFAFAVIPLFVIAAWLTDRLTADIPEVDVQSK